MVRGSILAVDDEEDVLELVRYNFNKEGFKVETAITGEEALKKAKANPPSAILLDRMLPGIDGIEVCRQLKADSKTSSIPIIMLTAKGEESDVVSGLEVGADDYVTKPFSPKVLIARVRRILYRATAAKQDLADRLAAGAKGDDPAGESAKAPRRDRDARRAIARAAPRRGRACDSTDVVAAETQAAAPAAAARRSVVQACAASPSSA